ncbi:MAG: exodeoxyribonuclease VII large subunit [Bacteroidales bacterium]|nr:exodeoxyribonuclease VII large subunit [Bacteroidales bacterium]
MTEAEGERHILGLSELLGMVREHIEEGFPAPVWVRAEISEVKNHPTGHCYLTLTESDGGLKAKVPAIIWASSYRTLRPFFASETGQDLQVGMNVLVLAQVQYSELYSLSLIISDIDPSFTIGGLELQRRRTIERLQQEGMMDMNATLSLPLLPRRFAVISAETAAGYRDFMKHLHQNEYGFTFHTELFQAAMQGTEAPASIMAAMDAVAQRADEFDALLILRGGGGAMDLVCFDDYELAVNVAQFPLPVLTGVGHDHDYHVIDMVAYANVKTPTALADFLVDVVAQEDLRLESIAARLQLAVRGKSATEAAGFENMRLRIVSALQRRFDSALTALDKFEMRVLAADPTRTLEKGYSIVLKDGRKLDSAAALEPGDKLTIMMRDASIDVTIDDIKR